MNGAFAFLIGTSLRNRARSQLRRLREPRYAIALVVGLLYFWSVLFSRGMRSADRPNALLGTSSEAIAPLLLAVILASAWVLGSDLSALAFSRAEVSLLFTAPVSRRELLVYKLARGQAGVIVGSLIWVLLLRRGSSGLPVTLALAGFWALFSTLSLHRLGAALVRASSEAHGAAGARRNATSIVVFGGIAATVLVQLLRARGAFAAADGPGETVGAVVAALQTLPARVALAPFRAALAPSFAHSAGAWATAMVPALALLAAHVWWVLRTDAVFEEAAAEASEARARRLDTLRARRGVAPVPQTASGGRSIALTTSGPPAVAIVWKNLISLMRGARFGAVIGPLAVGIAFALATGSGDGGARARPAERIALAAIVVAAGLLLFGGRAVRNDLRSDMPHLALLKTLPLRGRDIVLAEVASGTLPLAAVQLLMLVVAEVALATSGSSRGMAPDARLAVTIVSPLVLIALNGCMFAIVNTTAVLFPAWTRFGPTAPAGIEAMGQNLLATFGTLLSLALLLILPLLAGTGAMAFLHAPRPFGLAIACTAGALVLIAETYGLVAFAGRVFERAEPLQGES